MSYQVRLEVFEGPLDLLLKLIRRQELEITAISLAAVTDQYLAYMEHLEAIDPGALASFLEIAAQLVLIKSRHLLPRPVEEDLEEDEEDPAEALARRLREYAQFKEAAQALRSRDEQGLRAYVRVAPPPELPTHLELGDLSLADLMAAVEEALKVKPAPPRPPILEPIVVTLDEQIELVRHRLGTGQPVLFQSILQRCRSRMEVVVTFLAMLELIKEGEIRAWQEELFGEIWVQRVAREPA